MKLPMTAEYRLGPTRCIAHPEVVAAIQNEIESSAALSGAEIRMATAAGLITADTIRPVGFNDGLFYQPVEALSIAENAAAMTVHKLSRSSPRGALHALALLVDFDDDVGSVPPDHFRDLLFNAANHDSMTSYYSELSGGQLQVTGEVTEYIRMPRSYGFYTDGQSGMGVNYPRNTPGLLFEATDSLARFDSDGDGYVDGLFLIHAGGGAEAETDPIRRKNMIWSHKWVLPTPFVDHGVKAYAYSTEPEDGRLGVFAHEFGHVLGLPDLYDPTYRSAGVGDWCLMASGSWGGNGDRPTRLCCWSLAELGWVRPNAAQPGDHLALAPLAQDPSACYRLDPAEPAGREYFLVEVRRRAGRDGEVPGEGLALWHIDEARSDNASPLAYRVGLVQADGRRDLEFNGNQGDDADPFPGSGGMSTIDDDTNPSTRLHDGSPSGIALASIADDGQVVELDVV